MSSVHHGGAAGRPPSDLHMITSRLRSDEAALKVLSAVVGVTLLAPISQAAAVVGVIVGPLVADVLCDVAQRHEWHARKMWKLTAVLLLFQRIEQAFARARGRRVPVVVHLAVSVIVSLAVAACFTGVDAALGHSLVSSRQYTFPHPRGAGSGRPVGGPNTSGGGGTGSGSSSSGGGSSSDRSGGGSSGGSSSGGTSSGGQSSGGTSSGGGSSGKTLEPPLPPHVVADKPATNQAAVISWKAVSGATSYEVYRSSSLYEGGSDLGPVPTGTTYTDYKIPADGTWYYTVVAVGDGGTSDPSNAASVIRDTIRPAQPTGLHITSAANGYDVSWDAESDGGSAIAFKAWDTGNGSDAPLVSGTSTTLPFVTSTDVTVWVVAIDEAENVSPAASLTLPG